MPLAVNPRRRREANVSAPTLFPTATRATRITCNPEDFSISRAKMFIPLRLPVATNVRKLGASEGQLARNAASMK